MLPKHQPYMFIVHHKPDYNFISFALRAATTDSICENPLQLYAKVMIERSICRNTSRQNLFIFYSEGISCHRIWVRHLVWCCCLAVAVAVAVTRSFLEIETQKEIWKKDKKNKNFFFWESDKFQNRTMLFFNDWKSKQLQRSTLWEKSLHE